MVSIGQLSFECDRVVLRAQPPYARVLGGVRPKGVSLINTFFCLFVCLFFYLGHATFPGDIVKYAVFTYTKEAYFRYKLTRERK